MKPFLIPLFKGIDETEYQTLAASPCMREKRFCKGDYIFRAGDVVHELGLVCSGTVHIEDNDLWGNKSILSHITPGQVFAEAYALCREPLMVDAVAYEDTTVMFVDVSLLFSSENQNKRWYLPLMQNLLRMSARKNMTLSGRIFCTSAKTIRGRLSTYFSSQAAKARSNEFDLPFDRQGLADYLNVDRSALSKELCKMRDEGLLAFRKNHFRLHF